MAKGWEPDPDTTGDYGHFSPWPFKDVAKTQKIVVRLLIGIFFTIVLGSVVLLFVLKPILNKF